MDKNIKRPQALLNKHGYNANLATQTLSELMVNFMNAIMDELGISTDTSETSDKDD